MAWEGLVVAAVANAISGLSTMVGTRVMATELRARRVPIKDVPAMLGGADQYAVGVVLSIENEPGHMALVYKPETAWSLVEILLSRPPSETTLTSLDQLTDLERSALGEMGNIMGTFFLNTIGDRTHYELRPTPPSVVMDMTGAILDSALAEIMMESDDTVLVEATFGTKDRQISGTFVALPSPTLLGGIMRAWGKE